MGGGGVHLIKNSLYFGNVHVNKEERYCMGIKICQFTDPSLINVEHNKVDVESSLWKKITENQDVDLKKTNTFMLVYLIFFRKKIDLKLMLFYKFRKYLAAKNNSCKFKRDDGTMCPGYPILCKSHISRDVFQWFVGCSMYNVGDHWHRYIKVDCESVDIILLRDLFLGKVDVILISMN